MSLNFTSPDERNNGNRNPKNFLKCSTKEKFRQKWGVMAWYPRPATIFTISFLIGFLYLIVGVSTQDSSPILSALLGFFFLIINPIITILALIFYYISIKKLRKERYVETLSRKEIIKIRKEVRKKLGWNLKDLIPSKENTTNINPPLSSAQGSSVYTRNTVEVITEKIKSFNIPAINISDFMNRESQHNDPNQSINSMMNLKTREEEIAFLKDMESKFN